MQLSNKNVAFNPAKQTLLNRDQQLTCMQKISTLHSNNSGLRVTLDLDDPSCLFIAPRHV